MNITNTSLKEFLSTQKLLAIATVDEQNNPWLCNVYFGVDSEQNLYFVSANTNHTRHIEKNGAVAFTTSWFNPTDLGDRKAIQGKGICTKVTDWTEVLTGLKCMYKKFPDWSDTLTMEMMKNNLLETRLYKIKTNYMKFWNDSLYGEEGIEEFNS